MSKSLEQFGDLLALYDLGDDAWDASVAVAAEVVARGIATPGMVELASQPARGPGNVFEFGALVAAARDETGMDIADSIAQTADPWSASPSV